MNTFSFCYINESGVVKKIMNLNISKASLNSDSPAKLIKENLKAFKGGISGLREFLVTESYLKMMEHHLISP